MNQMNFNIEILEKWDAFSEDFPYGGGTKDNSSKTEIKEHILKCVDRCTIINIQKWDDEDQYFFTIYKLYNTSFWNRIKAAWRYIFKGEDLFLSDVILKEEDFNKLKEV